jgi:two-component system nitrogen regulation sensor histidine kinase NtrY
LISSYKLSRQSFLLVLLLASSVSGVYTANQAAETTSIEKLIQQTSSNLEVLMQEVDDQAKKIVGELDGKKSLPGSPFVFLLIQEDSLIAWNDHHFIPPLHHLQGDFKIKFLKENTGEFLVKKWTVDRTRFLVAIIPMYVQYKISNNYLSPHWNHEVFESEDIVLLDPADSQGQLVTLGGETVFRILPMPNSRPMNDYWANWTMLCFSLAIIALYLLITHRIEVISKENPVLGFLLLFLALAGARAIMIALEFPARFTDSAFFEPTYFASSELNPSLGDLVLNSIALLILCQSLARNYCRFHFFRNGFSNQLSSFAFSVFSVLCVLFGMLFPFVVVQTIYNNSPITLSISQSLHFDALRIVALLSVVLAWISSFFFMHVTMRLLAREKRILLLMLALVIGSVAFIVINTLSGQLYIWSLLTGVIYFVVVFSFSLFKSLLKFQYTTFIYFFIAVICFSLNGMFAVRHFEQQGNFQNQVRFANSFLDERDYFGEFLLFEATQRISADAFIQNRIASPFLGKEAIRQKIKQVSLSGYFNRYSVDVFLFNTTGESFETGDTTRFSTLISKYNEEAFRTGYEGVYFVTDPEGDFSRKYVVLAPIKRNDATVGYVVIELLLKRVIPENVYPELLVDNRFQQVYDAYGLSYATVANHRIQYSAGDFNYESFLQTDIDDAGLFTNGIEKEGYLHIAVEDPNGRIAIISSPEAPLIHWLADFSFQVMMGMTVILALLLVQGIYNYSKSQSLYLASRIQLIFNLAFFVPLIAVSIITLSLTTQSSQVQLNSEYLNKANQFGNSVAIALKEQGDHNEFQSHFTNLTVLANLDANVFYPNGRLMTTSQPLIFENNLLSPYLSATAYKRIQNGDKTFVSTEQVGNLQFYVAYSAVFSPDTGEEIAVLAIPFFQSESSLERMQITILANILSIFTIIFIALLAISFLVTKWLTAPLLIITKTMGRVSLTSANKPLPWQSNDEIGLMAREYNHMLIKLSDSKQELERNQRERAWREIAQQVAHEIKNPLTPMKLTLQQLERMLEQENQKNSKLSRSIDSLLSQVNSLDDIASSFSSFAKMPEPVFAEVELIDLLNKTINLHAQEGKILFNTSLESAVVLADEQLLGRIFSNVILNGLQARRPAVEPEIRVRLEARGSQYRISFADNGKGIDEDLAGKIFIPHFTTKQSGSGLGLAIAKQGIEQMGGTIWFENFSAGTTFYIELNQKK